MQAVLLSPEELDALPQSEHDATQYLVSCFNMPNLLNIDVPAILV